MRIGDDFFDDAIAALPAPWKKISPMTCKATFGRLFIRHYIKNLPKWPNSAFWEIFLWNWVSHLSAAGPNSRHCETCTGVPTVCEMKYRTGPIGPLELEWPTD
jgi:hypothetical protein